MMFLGLRSWLQAGDTEEKKQSLHIINGFYITSMGNAFSRYAKVLSQFVRN